MRGTLYGYLDARYRELAVLGNSEKRNTYLAQDEVTGQVVVKKYLSLENAEIYEKQGELRHKNLVPVLHVAKGDSRAVVILEYISGYTVAERLKKQGRFSEEETVSLICQLLEGLREIHSRNIIHRDINPDNLLISTDGVLKILDFDIGRTYKQDRESDTAVLGTAGYAAPEQFGFMQSDKRTDIYAVGILMNVMLTGDFPQRRHCADQKLASVISKCIQLEPAKRYQSAEELLAELRYGREAEEPVSRSVFPGFRTGVLWKKTVASTYYILMSVYTLSTVWDCRQSLTACMLEAFALFLYAWLSVFVSLDFLGWMEKTPLIRRFGREAKIAFAVFLWIAFFMAGTDLEKYVQQDILHMAVQSA